MAIHQKAALLLPLFVLLLLSKDSIGAVNTDAPAVGDVRAQGGSWNWENIDEGRVKTTELGWKLLEDDTNDYSPVGPNPKHRPHLPNPKHRPHFPPSI